jgi:hypothetical protein
MTEALGMPISGELRISSGDIVRSRYNVALGEREFIAVRSHDRLEICKEDMETPIGYITLGSARSGAIWNSGDCIAEYCLDENDEYALIPIVDNRKEPRIIRGIDPLLYLLYSLTEVPHTSVP